MEINDLPDKVFNIMVIMMFNKVRRKMYKQIENFNKDIKNIKEHQRENTKLKKTRTELKIPKRHSTAD